MKIVIGIFAVFVLGILALFGYFFFGSAFLVSSFSHIEPTPPVTVSVATCPQPITKNQTLVFQGVQVDIQVPEGKVIGDLLILPGWSFSRTDWCEKTNFCKKALAQGYRLILPEMGKSIYPSKVYPESRKDWAAYPTRTWLTDSLFPFLQTEHCLLMRYKPNYIAGLSTGARGVLLLIKDVPELFNAAAALSGDYVNETLTKDNLLIGMYGDAKKFPERWKLDNPASQTKRIITPLYLGHGLKDNVIPIQQTITLFDSIQKNNPSLKCTIHQSTEKGHDYSYWGSETDSMLTFFKRQSQ